MKSKNLHVRIEGGRSARPWSWAPALVWVGVLFFASSLPGTAFPKVGWPLADKAVHLGLYGVLGALVVLGARRAWPNFGMIRLVVRSVLIATTFGLSDEIHQLFVPFRSFDLWDLLADTLGAALGSVFVTRFLVGFRQR